MQTNDEIRRIVREKYSKIALAKDSREGCCSGKCYEGIDYSVFSEDYSNIKGYLAEADLGLGCGLPVEFARIHLGDTVIDLGSGAGNDCFIAREVAGEHGKVIGIDFSPEMIEKARENATKLGYQNVEFLPGDIEEIPLPGGIADVVVSNCVLNLVPDKRKAFSEIFRILRSGGHFSISDVVTVGKLPEKAQKAAELYAGCVSGAMQKAEYLEVMRSVGFVNIDVQKERQVEIPENILKQELDEDTLDEYRENVSGIYSINVFAIKP